jgi:preprotein translocase SecE subunit
MLVGVLIAAYTAFSWFRWHPFSQVGRSTSTLSVDLIIALALLVAVSGFAAWLCFRSPKSSDYLIDMDDELRKVVWPSVMPLFDPKTEAWGSTYVVIVCAIIFTIFIWLIDLILQYAITYGLFGKILFA